MKRNLFVVALCLLVLAAVPPKLSAQATPNPNCTIILPSAPLTAQGLATPYQLVATNPANGDCHEANGAQSAFVQAAILDRVTGQISIYNPVVIDQNSAPAVSPVVPALPDNAIVALWFGYNGDTLTLQADGDNLRENRCVNGVRGQFGQFAYCNAHEFFEAANRAIRKGKLQVPQLGTANDGRPCPTVRDFFVVDQDQSDNLPVTYLLTDAGVAQKTQINLSAFPTATALGNPSDNGLLDRFLDVALGCTPWKAPDLADPGQMIPALALNELQARFRQSRPIARIPAGDPMVLDGNGDRDMAKLNAYRRGVDQYEVQYLRQASTARYCRQLYRIQPDRLLLDQSVLTAAASPVPDAGNSLFTFMAQRFVATYDILGCADLLHEPDPITVTTDAQGVATSATIKDTYRKCRQDLAPMEKQDNADDDSDDATP
jgi:hypothetical protein